MKRMKLPLSGKEIISLRTGEEVLLSGTLYTARDQAHFRLADAVKLRKKLPIDLKRAAVYYTGPTPARPGRVIGSCGPTSSLRMDPFTPALLSAGLKVMIGKGRRSEAVRRSIQKHRAIYMAATGGAGALISRSVRKCRLVAYPELGAEAVYRLEVEDFPVTVAVDSRGESIYHNTDKEAIKC
jgi:fumarate hydratase subunit beta